MYNIQEKVIMWLSSFDFMSYKKARFINDNFDDLEDFFNNTVKYKDQLSSIFEKDEINEMIHENNFLYIDNVIKNYEDLGIQVVTCRSDTYPDLLKETGAFPIMLYCKGNVSLLKSECLGVVGTRRCTKYGSSTGAQIVKDVAVAGITIVSGLADGIDTVAHKACIDVKGKTIAVLGGGLLNIYPSNNITLAEKIVETDGLLVSEYKPNEPALTFHFPIRNRIIAGLSKGVFVVEATEKSGSMHTKNYAIEYNREVFALPARTTDIYSTGCNKIIQNGQARILLSSSEIIDFFGKFAKKEKVDTMVELSFDEQIIYNALSGHELHFDELASITKLETKVLLTMLMRMELKGVVSKLPGNYYSINRK